MQEFENLLSLEGLRHLLLGDLTVISKETTIPLSTLKNYRYGVSDLESIPYRLVKLLTDYQRQVIDVLAVPQHYLLDKSSFNVLKQMVRPDTRDEVELLNAQIVFNKQHALFLEDQLNQNNVYYFFIEDLDTLGKCELQVNIDTLMSVGLTYGIRFIINYDNYTQMLFGNVVPKDWVDQLKQEQMVQLGACHPTEPLSELVIQLNDLTVLLPDNLKLCLLRDYFICELNDASIWGQLLLDFLLKLTTDEWVELLTLDDPTMYLQDKLSDYRFKRDSIFGNQQQKLDSALLGVMLTYLHSLTNYKDVVRTYIA